MGVGYFYNTPGYVYLISSDTELFKIGISSNPIARVKQIQTFANKHSLGQLYLTKSFYANHALLWEQFFHSLYHHRQVTTLPSIEWFNLQPQDMSIFLHMPNSVVHKPTDMLFWHNYPVLDCFAMELLHEQQQLIVEQCKQD